MSTCMSTCILTQTRKTYVRVRFQKVPASLVKEAIGIINNGLHNLHPVETLYALRVVNVTGAAEQYIYSRVGRKLKYTAKFDMLVVIM